MISIDTVDGRMSAWLSKRVCVSVYEGSVGLGNRTNY